MTTYYKLTNENMQTYNATTQWELGVPQRALKGPLEPCTEYALHGYTSPLLAALLDPIHGDYGPTARLFECSFEGEVECDGLKVFGKKQTLTKEIPLPVFTDRQRILFAIRTARLVLEPGTLPEWGKWADAFEKGIETEDLRQKARTNAYVAVRNKTNNNAWVAVYTTTWVMTCDDIGMVTNAASVVASIMEKTKGDRFNGFEFAIKIHEIVENL